MLKKFITAKPSVQCAIVFVNEPHRVEVRVKDYIICAVR